AAPGLPVGVEDDGCGEDGVPLRAGGEAFAHALPGDGAAGAVEGDEAAFDGGEMRFGALQELCRGPARLVAEGLHGLEHGAAADGRAAARERADAFGRAGRIAVADA